jgi:YD repeat-containing protein
MKINWGCASFLGLLLVCSCATKTPRSTVRQETWMKDGQRAGTIRVWKSEAGVRLSYYNLSHQLVRSENCDSSRHLLPGQSVVEMYYDGQGRVQERRFLDAQGNPSLNKAGYAVDRFGYSKDTSENNVVVEQFLDVTGQPVKTLSGYAIKRTTHNGEGPIRRIEFLDVAGTPAPSTWLGVSIVVRVEYIPQKDGSTEMVSYDASGQVVSRRKISRKPVSSSSSGTYFVPYPLLPPPPMYQPLPPPPPRFR